MKKQDLMIGNLVCYEGKEITVESISDFGINLEIDDYGHCPQNYWIPFKDLSPIEITLQNLILYNFTKEPFNAFYIGKYVNGNYFTLYTENNIYYFFYESDGIKMKRQIKYVHDLQNIYYSLSGITLIKN